MIYRSGLSNPVIVGPSVNVKPIAPENLEVVETGWQKDGAPFEKMYVKFKVKITEGYIGDMEDAAGDDVFDDGTVIGNIDGTYSTNDTDLATKTDLSSYLSVGDRIYIENDPTRYIVEAVDSNGIRIKYGLLMDITTDNMTITRLTRLAECPEDSRTFRVPFAIDTALSIRAYQGFEYRGGFRVKTFAMEWDDAGYVGVKIETPTSWDYSVEWWTKNKGFVSETNYNQEWVQVNDSSVYSVGDVIRFDDLFEKYYVIREIDVGRIYISEPPFRVIPQGTSIWVQDDNGPANYQDVDTWEAYQLDQPPQVYKIYKSDTAMSDANEGELLASINASDTTDLGNGYRGFTWNATDHSLESRKVYFTVALIGGTGNESDRSNNAWLNTLPGQAYLTNKVINGDTLTVEYANIGADNPNLQAAMDNGVGGYNLYMGEWKKPESYIIHRYADHMVITSPQFKDEDVVLLEEIYHNVVWVAHVKNGQAYMGANEIVSGNNLNDYRELLSSKSRVKYLRVDQLIDMLDDSSNTYTMTIDRSKDMGVVIESYDPTAGDTGVE